MASGESVSISYHTLLDSRTVYKLLVMNLLTGPNVRPMEIISPITLARLLTHICTVWLAQLRMLHRATTFSFGDFNLP